MTFAMSLLALAYDPRSRIGALNREISGALRNPERKHRLGQCHDHGGDQEPLNHSSRNIWITNRTAATKSPAEATNRPTSPALKPGDVDDQAHSIGAMETLRWANLGASCRGGN